MLMNASRLPCMCSALRLTLFVLAVGIALPLAWLETHRGALLLSVLDVGPSAGYYGCLGVAIAGLQTKRRTALTVVIVVVLTARLTWSTMHLPDEGRMMSADLAHLVAFPMGLLWHFKRCVDFTPGESHPSAQG